MVRPVLFCLFIRVVLFVALAVHAENVRGPEAPVIATSAEGIPIHAYGDLYVYGVAPDLQPGNAIQEGNPEPKTKIQPMKS